MWNTLGNKDTDNVSIFLHIKLSVDSPVQTKKKNQNTEQITQKITKISASFKLLA